MTTTTASSHATCKNHAKDLLGDLEPLSVLAETADELTRIIGEHTAQQMRARPLEGRWTPNEIVGHLGDAEWAFGWRTRTLLGEAEAKITGFDQDSWVASQRLNDRDPAELVETFGQLRRCNLELWTRLTPEDLKRSGEGRKGPVSLGRLLQFFAQHDLRHLDQLRRYLAGG